MITDTKAGDGDELVLRNSLRYLRAKVLQSANCYTFKKLPICSMLLQVCYIILSLFEQ